MLLLWSSLITAIGGILLSVLVFFKAKRSTDTTFFALLSLFLSLVVAANFASLTNNASADLTLLWIRAVMFLVPPLMVFLYFFASSYASKNYKLNLPLLWSLLVLSIGVSVVDILPLAYKSVSISSSGAIVPQTGPGLAICGLFILPIFGLSILKMSQNARKAESVEDKRKINFALYYFLITFGLQITTSFVLVAIFNYTGLVPIGNFLTLSFIVLITVSIFQLKFFNVTFIGSTVFAIMLSAIMFVEIFLVSDIQMIIYKTAVFLAVSFIGYEFVKSIMEEIKLRRDVQELAEELKAANAHLKDLDIMKTEFVSVASHELLTPISAIEGYLSMILDEKLVKIEDENAQRFLENSYQSVKRLSRLVSDLLNVSRIEEGRLSVEKADIELSKLIGEVVSELKFKAQNKKIAMSVDLIKKPPLNTYADSDKVKEVLINLAGNAIKFTKEGGQIEIKADVWPTEKVKSESEGIDQLAQEHVGSKQMLTSEINENLRTMVGSEQYVISVKDNGVGISKDDMRKLFQKFSRVGDWNVMRAQGTGLGLYISKSLIEMHHGQIWAKSEGLGKGTTFYFSLPLLTHKAEIEKFDKKAPASKDKKPLSRLDEKELKKEKDGQQKEDFDCR